MLRRNGLLHNGLVARSNLWKLSHSRCSGDRLKHCLVLCSGIRADIAPAIDGFVVAAFDDVPFYSVASAQAWHNFH